MYTIILKIVSVNLQLLLCQHPQPQGPDCCCSPCLHSISLLSLCPSLTPSFFASSLVDALAPNTPSGRQRRDSSHKKKQREYWDHSKRSGKREQRCVWGGLTYDVKTCSWDWHSEGRCIVFMQQQTLKVLRVNMEKRSNDRGRVCTAK